MSFDLQVGVSTAFVFHASTIWPAVNKLAEQVDAIDAAADSLIATLQAERATHP